jgi:hypothetical protein
MGRCWKLGEWGGRPQDFTFDTHAVEVGVGLQVLWIFLDFDLG